MAFRVLTAGGRAGIVRSRLPGLVTMAVLTLIAVGAIDIFVFSSEFGGTDRAAGYEKIWIPVSVVLEICVLAWRHTSPVLVFCVLLAHSASSHWLLPHLHPTAGLLVALTAVCASQTAAVSVAATIASVGPAVFVVAEAAGSAPPQARTVTIGVSAVLYLLLSTGSLLLGRWLGRSHRQMAALEWQHLRDEESIATERRRIARELHDIVSHAVTVMLLHAAGASQHVETDVEKTRHALAVIQRAGAEATDELRRLLGILTDAEHADLSADGGSAGRIGDLDHLVAAFASTGVHVSLSASGSPVRLDSSVDVAAYRIVQESLTNSAKHAGIGASVHIAISWEETNVRIVVTDKAPATRPHARALSTGHGLVGLNERVAIAGGTLKFGPTDDGFQVDARLPASKTQAPAVSV